MDGYLAEKLWTERPDLPVIYMSGYSAEIIGNDTEFIRRTKSYVLHKPCALNALVQTVRQCLDEQPRRS